MLGLASSTQPTRKELQPFLPFEEVVRQRRHQHHQHDRERVSEHPVKLGHVLEVHAVDRRDQGRRHQGHRRDRENLDDVVLLDGHHAQHGIEQELDLAGEIARVVGQRLHVALHALKERPLVLGPAHSVGLVGEEEQQAPDRDQALAHFRGEIALAADGLEDVVVAPGAVGPPVCRLKDVVGDVVDLGADPLQDVRGPVDHRIEQVHHHGLAVHGRRAGAGELVAHHHERSGVVVTDGDEAMAGEDERDGSGLRSLRVGLTHQRRGHVAGAVLHVEAAGDLDLLHLLARRDRDADAAFDGLILPGGRIDQVEPDGGLRHVVV